MTSVTESQPIASSDNPVSCAVGVASLPGTTTSSSTTGYDCKFVETPPQVLPTECSICLHIPQEPHLVSCCGQHFCKSCIEHTQSENKPCPLCNQPDFTATLDKSVQRHLNALKVYCTNKEQGCEWVGELRQLDHHLNVNARSGEELTGCEFVEVSCIHGCGGRLQRRSLTEHHNICPSRPFSCEHCSHSSTYQDVVDNHLPVCGSHPVPCPNGCGSSSLILQHLGDHLHQDCPLQKINCEFQFTGCTAKVHRRDLAAHLRENLPQHLLLLSNTTKMLATAEDIKLRLGKLEGQQQSLKQKLDMVSVRERDNFTAAMSEMENVNDSFQLLQEDHQKTIEVTHRSLSKKSSGLRQRVVMIAIAVSVILFGIAMYQQNQIVGLQEAVDSLQQKMNSQDFSLQHKVESLKRAMDNSNTQETVSNLQQKVEELQQTVEKMLQAIGKLELEEISFFLRLIRSLPDYFWVYWK